MIRLYQVIFICYVSLIVFLLIDLSEAKDKVSHRQKRFLSFENVTHFFLRLNTKANMVPWCQIFAQALGFRMNWDAPPDSFHPYHHLYRRTVYSHLETLMDKNGLNGLHCIRRAICEMKMIPQPRGIYHKILKMVFRQQSSATDKWHKGTETDCEHSIAQCSFSMLDVSLYTDV
ncbi:uncharacterized protein LOC113234622 [Hyposmocoma kahamanoa]|uniref:uncharacterized protein LOC113234622 n=1 Tax=Hyposmocoma kahamanoa TaxID=1477025 RepID=UPI000E6D64D5|nr:uncharacterized protein LOC113234622 [Hyposmocoma kahamanoa]